MISALAIGFFTGFLLSVPIGPINLTVINEAVHKGFLRAFLIGVGGVTADTFYCTMAFFGFSSILEYIRPIWPMLQLPGGLIVFVIGINYTIRRHADFSKMSHLQSGDKLSHFSKAFPIGFFMGISNFSLFILWAGVNTILISHEWIKPDFLYVLLCVAGIMSGSLTWFFLISLLISRLHRQVNPGTISLITRLCGFLLLLIGVFLCYHSLFGTHDFF